MFNNKQHSIVWGLVFLLVFFAVFLLRGRPTLEVLQVVMKLSGAPGSVTKLPKDSVYVQPEQIHLSLGAVGGSMIVTWSTEQSSSQYKSFVKYGKSPFNLNVTSSATETEFYEENYPKGRVMFVHRASMLNLKPDTVYYYHVGNDLTVSDKLYFKTMPEYPGSWVPTIAMFGDMGNANAQSLPRLQRETQQGLYDAIIHVGDFAYDMVTASGKVGDEFMRQIESIAAYVPYMTCPGNHEHAYNFSHYTNRFSMPDDRVDRSNMFYSFNLGPAHFVSISTEHYYFMELGENRAMVQFDWLVKDLQEANSKENRTLRPWIILFGHRPMYCSRTMLDHHDDCETETTATRIGIPDKNIPGMEDLLVKYRVDLAFWAHMHDYERMFPMYNYKVVNGSVNDPYTNPKAPIHLITGSAGCQERHDPLDKPEDFTAFRSLDYGYTILKLHNGSALEFSQISDDQGGKIIDHVWVKKDSSQQWLTLDDY